MRAVLVVLALLAACSPFSGSSGGDDDDDDAVAPPGGADAASPLTDASTESGVVITEAGPSADCATTLATRSLEFETGGFDYEAWGGVMNQGGTIDQPTDSKAKGAHLFKDHIGLFTSATSSEVSDGAVVRLKAPVSGKPKWARVEWDAAVLEAGAYAAVGCTIGLIEDTERGRAYLATQQPGLPLTGLFPTLDSWWTQPTSTNAAVAPLVDYTPGAWQHFSLEVDFENQRVTVKAAADGRALVEALDRPWQPEVKAITSTCGALYAKSPSGTITTKVEMDHIVLAVCPQ